ncbi:MAG: ABC transporter permease subunit [Anaerolineae bacterium]|nr:ABC transporter permease subunit [Anaerolineae bacterium]
MIWYAFIVVVFQTIISLALALMMNARFAGRRWFRTLFYAPSVTSSVVISLIFLWLFNGRGIVNYIMYEVLDLTEPLGNLGLRTPNTNWLNTADRLGDLTYLKPFFDNSWYFLLGIPLLIVIVMALVRGSLWLRDRALNGRAVLASGLAALATLVVLVVVLGVLAGATGAASGEAAASAAPIQGSVVIATLLVSLGFGVAGGLVINFLELELDRPTATRSAALGVIAAVLIALPVACLVGLAAAPEAFALTGAVQVTAYTLMVVPLIVGPLTAAFTADVSHRLFMADVRSAEMKPQPGGNMARRLDRWVSWMGTGLLTVLAIWCVVMVLAAAATTGLGGPKELGDQQFGALLLRGPSVAFLIIMVLNIFTTSPTFMIMFLAALQDVPGQLYEAAQIDGANRWQQFWQITLPVVRPVMLLIVVLGTIGTFQIFDQVHVMTAGGPLNTTLTPVYLIYTKAIGDQRSMQMGYAAAMAFILGAIIFVITYIQRNYIEKGTEQY